VKYVVDDEMMIMSINDNDDDDDDVVDADIWVLCYRRKDRRNY